jgi:hypothetical protein
MAFHIFPHVEAPQSWGYKKPTNGPYSSYPHIQQVSLQEVPHIHMEMRQNSLLLETGVCLGNFPLTGAATIVPICLGMFYD